MNKLLIVGTVAYDAIETPFGKTDKILGGAATYIGLSASHFNVKSAIVSVVGNDFSQEYLDLLSSRNIDISGIEIVKEGKTFFWSGLYHNDLNSRDTLDTQLNVLADFNPIVPEDFKDSDVIMLGNLHPNIQIGVLDQLTAKPKLVVLDTM
ncbi:MAG: PfkB family carbohydrate kinase, partial [Myroides sp.]